MNEMTHNARRKTISMILAAMILMCAAAAYAGTSIEQGSTVSVNYDDIEDRVRNLMVFKYYVQEYGIGYGTCPVYTAPSEDAFRAGNGKACCDTDSPMSVGGYDATGWLMVRYDTNDGGSRVGYIPPEYVRGYRARINLLEFDRIPVQATDTIYVTDNPMTGYASAFAALDRGELFHILGKYTYSEAGNWWYIECTVDGRVARGFIEISKSGFIAGGICYGGIEAEGKFRNCIAKQPPEGMIGTVRIKGSTQNSDPRIVRGEPTTDSELMARVTDGEEYPCYDTAVGPKKRVWYKILINEGWGWISSGVSTFE